MTVSDPSNTGFILYQTGGSISFGDSSYVDLVDVFQSLGSFTPLSFDTGFISEAYGNKDLSKIFAPFVNGSNQAPDTNMYTTADASGIPVDLSVLFQYVDGTNSDYVVTNTGNLNPVSRSSGNYKGVQFITTKAGTNATGTIQFINPNITKIGIIAVGGGGGGGGGANSALTSAGAGGGGGGGGGCIYSPTSKGISVSTGTVYSLKVGGFGYGGAGKSTSSINNVNGDDGTNGGNTGITVGSTAYTAYGGNGGGGASSNSSGGTGGDGGSSTNNGNSNFTGGNGSDGGYDNTPKDGGDGYTFVPQYNSKTTLYFGNAGGGGSYESTKNCGQSGQPQKGGNGGNSAGDAFRQGWYGAVETTVDNIYTTQGNYACNTSSSGWKITGYGNGGGGGSADAGSTDQAVSDGGQGSPGMLLLYWTKN